MGSPCFEVLGAEWANIELVKFRQDGSYLDEVHSNPAALQFSVPVIHILAHISQKVCITCVGSGRKHMAIISSSSFSCWIPAGRLQHTFSPGLG